MQTKEDSKVASTRDYQDYSPATEFVEEENCDTLLIYLPGFKKDQLRVQLTTTPTLKISGERHIGDNKWSRFQKEYPVSTNCETNKITAKFNVGILYILLPKLITSTVKKDEEKPLNEAQKPQKNDTEPPLPQNTDMKSDRKTEDEDKIASKSEEKEEQKGGVEDNDSRKRKRVGEFENGDFMTGRVKMAKKVGRMVSVVMLVLSAVVLGIYVKNLVMPATNYEN